MSEQTNKSVGEIEADIAATRARLASTIDELAVRAQPKEIARRQADSAMVKLNEATHTPTGRAAHRAHRRRGRRRRRPRRAGRLAPHA